MKNYIFHLNVFLLCSWCYTLQAQHLVDLIPYRKGDKWGYVNTKKEIVIPPQFDDAFTFQKGLGRVFKGDKFGFIDKRGNLVVDFIYQDPEWEKERGGAFYFDEAGLMPVYREGLWGFMDSTGKEIIPCQYEYAYNFSDGYARVKQSGKWGFIKPNGEIQIPFEYETVLDFHKGFAPAEFVSEQFGVIDTSNQMVIPFEYKYIYPKQNPHCLIAVIKQDGIAGYIDIHHQIRIPLVYGNATPFENGRGKVYRSGVWGYVDSTGREVIPPQYRLAFNFKDSLAIVGGANLKYGAINTKGDTIIALVHDHIGFGLVEFSKEGYVYVKKPMKVEKEYLNNTREGLIPAYKNTRAGVYNYQGEVVIPFKYEYISPFENGLAIVLLNSKFGYIDKNGVEYFED